MTVLSIGVIGPAGVGYYLGSVASGVDDYYLEADPGIWYGVGAAAMDLVGQVVPADLHQVLDAAASRPSGRKRVAAFDVTLSAPKSVSILAELGDPEIRVRVLAEHRAAVTATVGLLERHAVRGRRGHNGVRQVATTGIVAAGFDHRSSRSGDPQTHTHLLVANRALGVDGQMGAVYGRRLFGWAKTAGVAYQSFLRAGLTEALGVEWGPVVNGMAEITGIPQDLRDEFSTRRVQIVGALQAEGRTSTGAARIATLATRPEKPEPIAPEIARGQWRDRSAAIGIAPEQIRQARGHPRQPTEVDLGYLAAHLTGPAGLTARQTTFDARNIYQAVAGAHPEGLHPDQLHMMAGRVAAHPDVLAVGRTELAGPSWTTAELTATETRLLGTARRQRETHLAVCPEQLVNEALAGRNLSGEQSAMVRRICSSGDGVEIVVGRPGTGKTYALNAAATAWANNGNPVIGTALAARTARSLEAATGVRAGTLDSLLGDLSRPEAAPAPAPGTVILVDETGMVGTRSLARLLTAAETHKCKVVLVGDPAQLPELEAGGAFAALAKQGPSVELTTNRRQEHSWERDALEDIRTGKATTAIGRYQRAGRLTLSDDAPTAQRLLVADWATLRPERSVMVALTRAEVAELNHLAREHLVRRGDVAPDGINIGDETFGVGDRVMTLRNDRRLGVLNGTTGTVVATSPAGALHLQPDGGGPQVTLPNDYLAAGHVAHGWAVTVYKSQGLTVDTAFVLGSERLYREAGYVALSRARHNTHWYQVAPPGSHLATPDPQRETARLIELTRAQRLALEYSDHERSADDQTGPETPAPAKRHGLGLGL